MLLEMRGNKVELWHWNGAISLILGHSLYMNTRRIYGVAINMGSSIV